MKRFKDFIIKCCNEVTAIAELRNIEEACTIPEFKRDEEVEKMYEPDERVAHILVNIAHLPKAVMFIWADEGNVKLLNVVPFENSVSQLEVDQYNQMVDLFLEKIVEPIIGDRYLKEITSGEYSLKEIIPKSYDYLYKWSKCPGAPSAPFSHQLDLEKWFEFLCQLISNNESLSSGELEQWLREEARWSEGVIDKAILKYEEEIDLLDYYANRR